MKLGAGHRRRASRSGRRSTTRRSSCPLGGILGAGQSVDGHGRYTATLRSTTHRLELAVHPDERHRRRPPLDPVGQPRRRRSTGRTTATRSSRRSARASGSTITTDRHARLRDDRRAGRERRPHDRRSRRRTSATSRSPRRPTTRSTSAMVGDTTVRVYYRPGAPASRSCRPRSTRSRRCEPLVGPYPYADLRPRPDRRRLRDGVAGPDLDPDRGRGGEPLVPRPPRDRPPVVLRDRRQRPGARAVHRRGATDFLARYVLGPAARVALLDGPARPVDLPATRSRATTRSSTSRAATSSTTSASGWARRRSGRGLRDYVAANRFELTTTKTLLDTLDDHTSLNLVPRFEPRFPRLY